MTQQPEESAVLNSQETSEAADARDGEAKRSSIGEFARTVIYALLIAIVFRTVLFQPFSIPSGSMKPTLLIGDYLFVSKYSYGYSRFSLPWGSRLPESFLQDRLLGDEPERGDVIVFRNPRNPQEDYIKRLVGLPGDTVRVTAGLLYINDEPVAVRQVDFFVETFDPARDSTTRCIEGVRHFAGVEGVASSRPSAGEDCTKEQFVETLPNGVEHVILNSDSNQDSNDNTRSFIVPEDQYFFMGDNRDNSEDSRGVGLGMVPRDHLIGRAEFILLSSEGGILEFWNWRSDRFFQAIE